MDTPIDRRDFGKQSVGGLLASALLGNLPALADDQPAPPPHDKRLVLLGLNALARAHEMNYFADGHRGAALISAHSLCVDNKLGDQVTNRVTQLFDLNWAKTKLCRPFPETDPEPENIKKIGLALADNTGVLRQVGHDAIFASLAIKGFRMLPEAATPERIDGVCKLVRAMTPWRDIDPDPEVKPPPFSDQAAASKFVIQEASDAIDRFVGFGQGFAGHMLTFGQALVELAAMGDVEWAESCRVAFRKYVTVTRKGPAPGDRKIPDHKPTKLRPTDAEYWRRRGDKTLGIGHVFKYPYGYYDLIRRADDEQLARTFDEKAWHVF